MAENALYYGDNLDVLRRYLEEESVDLIYLDPPFKSDQNFNVLFDEQDGSRSAAQILAFEDTWRWDQAAAAEYQEIVEGGGRVSQVMQAFRQAIGDSDMLAYLAMMAPRLVELRRVLTETGSIYLHCDPTASHYLKLLMDAIFGPENFRNELIWKRTHAHGSSKRYGPLHDTILFYSKTDDFLWTDPRLPHDPEYIERHFTYDDGDGRLYQPITLTGSGVRNGESGKPWRRVNPTKVGRHWAIPGDVARSLGIVSGTVQQRLDALDAAGLIYWPDRQDGTPRLKWYADKLDGVAIADMWTDIPPIPARAAERLGYPTQKPEALLERLIAASSNKGDIVLDPFCGCGTAVAAAQKLERKWIGIDITHLAITLIKHRLLSTFGNRNGYSVIGEPVSIPDAQTLAKTDPYQFQWWALGLVGARPTEQKKGADKGIDGRLFFHDEGESGKTKQILFSVKAGSISPSYVRDLRGVIDRERAAIGVLISWQQPTKAMRAEAAAAGLYNSPWGTRHPKLQLLTVIDLLEGVQVDMPATRDSRTFKKPAKKMAKSKGKQKKIDFGSAGH